jgi:competence protein ComEC
MDAVAAPAVGSEAADGANRVELSTADASAQILRRYQPLVVVTLAVATGIVWDRYGPQHVFAGAIDSIHGSLWFVLWWCACASCLLAWWLLRRRRRDGHAAWLLLAAAALAGSAWHELNWFLYDAHEIGRYAAFEPEPTCIEAIALESTERVAAPRPTPLRAIPVGERSRLPIELTGIRDGAQWKPASGVCQLSVEGHLLGIHQGDHLRIFGQLARISPQQNPGEFDFAAHARADRQMVRVRSKRPESITTIEPGSVWSFARQAARQIVDRTEPCWAGGGDLAGCS